MSLLLILNELIPKLLAILHTVTVFPPVLSSHVSLEIRLEYVLGTS